MQRLFLLLLVLFSFSGSPIAAEIIPTYSTDVSYWSPRWYNNNRIIYLKRISHFRHEHGFLASISNSGNILVAEEYFICTSDLNGNNEQVIRKFTMKKSSNGIDIWNDIFLKGGGYKVINRYIDYNRKKDLIVIPVTINNSNIFILFSGDGEKLWKLDINGTDPKLSPEGDRLLYTQTEIKQDPSANIPVSTEKSIWLVDIFGTNNKKIIENATNAIWHPDGNRIMFSRKDPMNNLNSTEFILNISTSVITACEINYFTPIEWLPDKDKILTTSGIFSIEKKEISPVNNMLNDPRLSPDGKHMLGIPKHGEIGIIDSDGSNSKIIF